MTYDLQRVLFPPTDFLRYPGLFVRESSQSLALGQRYIRANVYQFNTWMNIFAAKKWYKYCDIGELYLKARVKGAYRLHVVGIDSSVAFGAVETVLLDTAVDAECTETLIPNAKNYDGVSFTIFADAAAPIEIISTVWSAEKPPCAKNKLAVVSCTFKRERYILKTIATIENFIQENPAPNERIKLFVVDNGKTLDTPVPYAHTAIIPNMNAGGAGGFTRGLMEITCLNRGVQQSDPYTRVLFMDDDIEIIPEVLFRTLVLADYLRDEYKDAFINGAMMNLYEREMLFENLGILSNFEVSGYIKNVDVSDYNNILKAIAIPDSLFTNPDKKIHSAWWYNCFPISLVEKKGLPYPFFIRGDDIEWSWRRQGTRHISINGVCIWHAPFDYKFSIVIEYYYSTRNYFMNNVLYTIYFKEKFVKYFKTIFSYLLKTYNYNAVDIFFQALDDISNGGVIFKENPEKQFQSLNQIAKKVEYFDADMQELEQAKKQQSDIIFMAKLFRIYKIAMNILRRRQSTALEGTPPIDSFIFHKEVKVYNLLTGKYCIRKRDKKRTARYQKEFYQKLRKIKKNYDALKKNYEESFKELTSFAFWEKYLALK